MRRQQRWCPGARGVRTQAGGEDGRAQNMAAAQSLLDAATRMRSFCTRS